MRIVVPAFLGFVFLTILSTLFGSWYTIDEGEKGVLTRNGAVTGVADAGLGFKLPFVDGVTKITLRTQLVEFKDVMAYSKDQQTASMRISVNYEVVPSQVRTIYSQYGSLDNVATRLIQPRIYEELKTVFGAYTAVSAIQERQRLNDEVREAISKAVAGPITITGVQLENIDFSDTYEQNIEARMTAEVEVQRLKQQALQAQVTAEITVTNAKAQADSQKAAADAQSYTTTVNAKAEADATVLRGNAEASAIKARGDALKENPGLVALTQAERWDGKLPSTMLPGGAVPMLSLQQPQ